ncbi:MAG: methionyl-tRNA formyltransferase, partial [Candidatus Methylomirabilales bacterium]
EGGNRAGPETGDKAAVRILLLLGDFGLPTMAALLGSPHRPVGVVLATSTASPPPLTPGRRARAWLRPLLWPGIPGPPPRDFRPWTAPGVLTCARVPHVAAKEMDTSDLCRLVATHRADLLLSVGYPKILPPPILEAPPHGGLNVHPSLLPRYRGPSPVFWQVALGETRSGVTVHRMTPGLDEGPILSQAEIGIVAQETTGALVLRLARLAARLVLETLDRLAVGVLPERAQDPAAGSLQRRFRDEDSLIDWSRPAENLARLVRACNPFPGARTFSADGETVRIWRARALTGPTCERFGEIVALRRGSFAVTTGSGLLRVDTATSDRGRRFPAWGRPWPALVPGRTFTPGHAA